MDTDDWEVSKEFADALDGDRTAALGLWQQVANGRTDRETRAWILEVAKKVVAADSRSGNERIAALVAAIGMSKALDRHRALRERLSVLLDFDAVGRKSDLLAAAREFSPDDKSKPYANWEEKALRDMIDREMAKL